MAKQNLATKLLCWFDDLKVQLPWRGSRDPYRIWLSEIMLQQTRIAAVEAYYERFLNRFPTLETLAAASLDEVLKVWEGLGYYSRARNLHRFAQIVTKEHQGKIPNSAEALQQLPGIGRYTAAAIASIAFDERVAVLDGNVMRVLSRLMDFDEDITELRAQTKLWQRAESLLPKRRVGDYNQALMDLGRLICTPRNPNCKACPLQSHCLAFANGTTTQRPNKKAKPERKQVNVAVAVIRNSQGQLLLMQRPANGLLGGLWTLPGGFCEESESLTDALQRIVQKILNLKIRVREQMVSATQDLTHLRMIVRAFKCEIISGKPKANGVEVFAWVSDAELDDYSFGKADRAIVEALNQWQPRLFEELI